MRNNKVRKGLLLMGALATGGLLSGCGAELDAEDPTGNVSEAISTASNSSDALEAANLMRGPRELKNEAVRGSVEGFKCDPTPDITYVDVCGQSLPATVHLEWTDCAPPGKGPGRGRPDGGQRPPPPFNPRPDGGMHGGPGGRGGPGHGPSSGTVDITYSYTAPANCQGAILQQQSATFSITRTGKNGGTGTAQGTSTSSAELLAGQPPRVKSTQVTVTRTRRDAAGLVVNSVQLTGSKTVAFSSDVPPTRTINGSFTEVFSDGRQGSVTLTDVVQPPRDECAWPISGTLTRVTPDAGTHVLVYGPDCGDGTLDGVAVEVAQIEGRGGPGHGRGPGPNR